jgi:dihydrofolate reductase
MRPRCSVYIATSLDGFIARPDGGIDWLSLVERPGEDYGYHRFFETVDALVVGKKTYEAALGFDAWPYAGKRCVVLTHGALSGEHGEEAYAGPLDALLASLGDAGVKRVYVDGGNVIQQFLGAGLVDDLTISVVPVLLGEGSRLFGPTGGDVRLELVGCRSFESGLAQLEYRRAHLSTA